MLLPSSFPVLQIRNIFALLPSPYKYREPFSTTFNANNLNNRTCSSEISTHHHPPIDHNMIKISQTEDNPRMNNVLPVFWVPFLYSLLIYGVSAYNIPSDGGLFSYLSSFLSVLAPLELPLGSNFVKQPGY